jgi:hypothetical protein
MKHLLLIIICLIILTGCSKKNDASKQPLIVGHWDYAKDSVSTYFADTLFNTSITEAQGSYYQFNADGTGLIYFNPEGLTSNITYQVNGSNLTIHFAASRTNSGIAIPAYTAIPKITSLTAHQLVIVYDSGIIATNASNRRDVETTTLTK